MQNQNLENKFELIDVTEGQRCLNLNNVSKSQTFIFSYDERSHYETTLPEYLNEKYYTYEVNKMNSKTMNLRYKSYKTNIKCKSTLTVKMNVSRGY